MNPQWSYQLNIDGSKHMAQEVYLNRPPQDLTQTNYQKLWEQTQQADENPTEFMAHLTKALIKFTHVKPKSPEWVILFNSHFISQAAPDIQTKFKKSDLGPHYPQGDFLDGAFHVFSNRRKQQKHDSLKKDFTPD